MMLLALLVGLAVLAGPATGYMRAAANQLFEPSGYIDSVLAPVEKPEKAEVDPPLDAADPHAEEEH